MAIIPSEHVHVWELLVVEEYWAKDNGSGVLAVILVLDIVVVDSIMRYRLSSYIAGPIKGRCDPIELRIISVRIFLPVP